MKFFPSHFFFSVNFGKFLPLETKHYSFTFWIIYFATFISFNAKFLRGNQFRESKLTTFA